MKVVAEAVNSRIHCCLVGASPPYLSKCLGQPTGAARKRSQPPYRHEAAHRGRSALLLAPQAAKGRCRRWNLTPAARRRAKAEGRAEGAGRNQHELTGDEKLPN